MSQKLQEFLESTGYFKQYKYDSSKNESGNYSNPETASLYYGFRLRDQFAQQELSKTKEQLRIAVEVLVKMKGYGYDGHFPIEETLKEIEGLNE